jgi:hypothetical protein
MCQDELAQGRGIVWRHGGIDGKPGERLCFGLTPWSWVREKKGGAFAHGAFFGYHKGVSDGDNRGKRP